MAQPPNKLDRGYHGEQNMGFYFGEKGYFFVEGPSGASGHQANGHGFDGVAYSIGEDKLILLDNKSKKDQVKVYSATAIDPNKNLLKKKGNKPGNLDELINKVRNMSDMPSRIRILQLLKITKYALDNKQPLPANVKLAVTNAGGRSTGVGGKLAAGVEFIDVYAAAPNPKIAVVQPAPLVAGKPAVTGKPSVRVNLISKGKSGGGYAQGAGKAFAMSALGVLISYAGQKAAQAIVEGQFNDKVEEQLAQTLETQLHDIARLQLAGDKVYANINYRVWTHTTKEPEGGVGPNVVQTKFLDLLSVAISTSNKEGLVKSSTIEAFNGWEHNLNQEFVFSTEVGLSQENLQIYKAFNDELNWFDDAARNPRLSDKGRDALALERNVTIGHFQKMFGK